MRDLHKFLVVPFDDKTIGTERLTTFASDHLMRMTDNNTGGFLTARIAATTTALAGVETQYSTDQTKLAIRKSLVLAKDNFRRDLPKDIVKIYGQCLGHYAENSVEMMEIFPEGRSVFASVKDDGLTNKLDVLIAGITAHTATLGAALVTQATAVRTNWQAVYAASEVAISAKATTKESKNAARSLLQLELFKNLLTIALQFPRQPEMLDVYMQQSLLESPASPEPPTPPAPNP